MLPEPARTMRERGSGSLYAAAIISPLLALSRPGDACGEGDDFLAGPSAAAAIRLRFALLTAVAGSSNLELGKRVQGLA